eukprot:TRINITY_DN8344_c0_g1_i2.p1 TRINITY_DN8344_c0_g1~~TRINITY_DN8344_c0_g1_i2.p1  ORF type:complete len:713 (+),score=161.35 TRINITY_DN8344_c0_g1_i2:1392-3530(+)
MPTTCRCRGPAAPPPRVGLWPSPSLPPAFRRRRTGRRCRATPARKRTTASSHKKATPGGASPPPAAGRRGVEEVRRRVLVGCAVAVAAVWLLRSDEAAVRPETEVAEEEVPEGQLPAVLRRAADEHRKACAADRLDADAAAGILRLSTDSPLTNLSEATVAWATYPLRTGRTAHALITARTVGRVPTCRGGDMLEAVAEGPSSRYHVVVEDIGSGLYHAHFLPRTEEAELRLCMRLYYPSRMHGAPRLPNRTAAFDYGGAFGGRQHRHAELGDRRAWCTDSDADLHPRCIGAAVSGPQALPDTPCPTSWRGGLPGSWHRSPGGCRAGLCEGDLRYLSTEWVYVPRSCYLRVYGREAAWKCLAGKRVLWFGDSTQRQTATNLVEMLLGTPALHPQKSMKWAYAHCSRFAIPRPRARGKGQAGEKRARMAQGKVAASKGCMDYTNQRRWSGMRPSPLNGSEWVDVRYAWGGGVKPDTKWGSRPAALDHLQPDPGTKDAWSCPRRSSRCTDARRDVLAAVPAADFVFLNGFLWDMDAHDWRVYAAKARRVLDLVLSRARPGARVHWGLAPPQCLDDRRDAAESMCGSLLANKMASVLASHSNRMMLDTVLAERGPRVTATDRMPLAAPWVAGHTHCHEGMHFGVHAQECYIWNTLAPEGCARNWDVDKMQMQVWMNVMCDAPPGPGSSAGSIEDGPPKRLGNWLPGSKGNPEPEQ